jgi:hypothetical protein
LAAEAFYFLLDQKVTKNQVSKEASLRSGPLPGSSGTEQKFRFLMRIQKERKGLSGRATGSFALRGGSDRPDLIYPLIVCF